jgi:putative addiction module killer protein
LTAIRVVTTDVYDKWLQRRKRKDPRTGARIQMRVDRLITGNPGDAEAIGGGLSELRIHHGPGYRVYYWQQGDVLLILLCGGDKSSQTRDIEKAHEIAKEWENRGEH